MLQEQKSQFKNGTGQVELSPLQDRSLLALQGKSMNCHCKAVHMLYCSIGPSAAASCSTTRWCERRPEEDKVHDQCSDGRVQYH